MKQYLPNPQPSKFVTSDYVRIHDRAILTPSGASQIPWQSPVGWARETCARTWL
jgi:hypothetical protein